MASYRKYQTKKGQRWMVTVSYTDRFGKYRQVNKAGFKLKKKPLRLHNNLKLSFNKRIILLNLS